MPARDYAHVQSGCMISTCMYNVDLYACARACTWMHRCGIGMYAARYSRVQTAPAESPRVYRRVYVTRAVTRSSPRVPK